MALVLILDSIGKRELQGMQSHFILVLVLVPARE
jgi:hypothetical protein